MKKLLFPMLILSSAMMISCGGGSDNNTAPTGGVAAFDSLIKALPDEQILDVRTAEEFQSGYIDGARNIDWNSQSFPIDVNALEKSKPVLIYCRSGRRSAEAATYLRNNGFTDVRELEGGISAWQEAGLPVVVKPTTGVTHGEDGPVSLDQYKSFVAENKVVLVDFTATWCGPCKLLAPRLHELETEMSDKFVLLKVDVDRDRPVAEYMNIAAMPTLVLYKDGQISWRNEGLVEKSLIADKITSVQ